VKSIFFFIFTKNCCSAHHTTTPIIWFSNGILGVTSTFKLRHC